MLVISLQTFPPIKSDGHDIVAEKIDKMDEKYQYHNSKYRQIKQILTIQQHQFNALLKYSFKENYEPLRIKVYNHEILKIYTRYISGKFNLV